MVSKNVLYTLSVLFEVMILDYKRTTSMKKCLAHMVAHNSAQVGMDGGARALATRQLTPEEIADETFDILTGHGERGKRWQLVFKLAGTTALHLQDFRA